MADVAMKRNELHNYCHLGLNWKAAFQAANGMNMFLVIDKLWGGTHV